MSRLGPVGVNGGGVALALLQLKGVLLLFIIGNTNWGKKAGTLDEKAIADYCARRSHPLLESSHLLQILRGNPVFMSHADPNNPFRGSSGKVKGDVVVLDCNHCTTYIDGVNMAAGFCIAWSPECAVGGSARSTPRRQSQQQQQRLDVVGAAKAWLTDIMDGAGIMNSSLDGSAFFR